MARIRFTIVLLVLLTFLISFGSMAQEMPALPETSSVVTCLPDTTGYVRITVGASGKDYLDLQEAIDDAVPGTVILVHPDQFYLGGFVLPDKGQSDQWIIIASARMDLLPAATHRVEPLAPSGDPEYTSQEEAMPDLVTSNLSGIPVIKTQPGAHHYWLMGLEVTADTNVIESYGLINFGQSGSAQQMLSQVPHHLVLDRCYVHGHGEGTIMKYGVRLDCANAAVMDCHFSEFHSMGFDAQAISCINGPGPLMILNNYLEASGENILIGGGTPSIAGLVPSDIVIRQNHLYKPFSWRVGHPDYAGKHWTIKNLFELKTGQRVLFEGNLLENSWADLPIGQSGYAILLTVRTENGNYPEANVADVMIRDNIIRHAGAGITLSGSDGANSIRSERIMIYNNLFEDINGPLFGDQQIFGPNDGTFLKIGNPANVTIDHNTILQTGPITWAYAVTDSFIFTRNIVHCYVSAGGYRGIYGPGQMEGNKTFAAYFPDVTDANLHFHENLLIAGDASRYDQFMSASRNYFPADSNAVGFIDYTGGDEDFKGYGLAPSSPYFLICDDGLSPGVDIDQLQAAIMAERDCDMMETFIPEPNIEEMGIDVYPNPGNGSFFVECPEWVVVRYQCYDMTGRLIQQERVGQSSFRLDLPVDKNGVYLIVFYLEDRVICQRLIVQ